MFAIDIVLYPTDLGIKPFLIPRVAEPISLEKDGLVNKNQYQSFYKSTKFSSTEWIKLFKHSDMGAWTYCFIEILAVNGPGGGTGKVLTSISSDANPSKTINACKYGNPPIEIYKDSDYIYIKKIYSYGVNISIKSSHSYPLESSFTNIDEPVGVTKVEFSA